MTAGTDTFTFAFLANSDLLSAIQYPSSISAARSYEPNRDLITGVEHKHDTTVVSNYFYENDVIGRRRFMEKSGTAFAFHPQTDRITYEYNDRSEVVGAESSLAATYDYGFSFDPIGNRLTSTSKETGTPVTRNYTSNNLNQYTAVDNPSVAPSYDDDGNMTALPISSGTWDCSWNAENRLIAMEKADKRLEFAYDHLGRRVEKKTYTGSSGNWTLAAHLRFVYDGYLQIEELDAADSNVLLKKRYWTGVEGYDRLISETHVTTGNTYYAMTDANKNLTCYLTNAGAIAGHFEFSPFGQITRETGGLSNEFDFRFSSEFFEQETGLVYYNFRYYSPELGRWMSRDPIEEIGGLNLYCFILNGPIVQLDVLGLLDSITLSFWRALAAGNYTEAAFALEMAAGTLSPQAIAAMAAILAAATAPGGLIGHLDGHIQKAADACPGLSPNPKDPKHDPFKGFIDEIKAAIKNLKQLLKHAPKNKLKRQPIEDAIRRGEEFIKQVENAGKVICPQPSCEPPSPSCEPPPGELK